MVISTTQVLPSRAVVKISLITDASTGSALIWEPSGSIVAISATVVFLSPSAEGMSIIDTPWKVQRPP